MKFGVHLGLSGGYAALIRRAVDIGCECLQLFSRNPRSWTPGEFDVKGAERVARESREAGIGPVFVHASYLVNLASPDPELRQRSIQSLFEDIRRAEILGAAGVVTHPGSHKGAGWDLGRDRLLASLEELIARLRPGMAVILENTAGGGNSLGGRLEEFYELASALDAPELGFCLDTAHLFAAGYDVGSRKSMEKLLDDWDAAVGIPRLRLMHINDTIHPRGGRRDQHAHIGEGLLGDAGLANVVSRPRLESMPGILETPKDSDLDDKRNLERIRRLARNRNKRRRKSLQ